ncbi:hypothetical protein GCM10023166_32020 [Paeniglutamicibacter cryotolerans]
MSKTGGDTVQLRGARHDDVAGIQEFSFQMDRPAGSESFLHSCIDDPGRRIIVAIVGARIVGWANPHWYENAEDQAPAGP